VIARKDKISDENLEGAEDGSSNIGSPLRVDRPISLHLIIQLLPESTAHMSTKVINPLPKASVEGKQRKRKPQESEILPGTPYKTFIESKEKEKASKMKRRAERQLKGLETAQEKKEKSGSQKIRQCEN
jgi:hypothetical protein